MVRLRKLALAVAAATALSSGMAHALGLGEITLKSGLNQPLNAEIELVEVKDLNQSEVIPSLGSPEDFSKAGVDRAYFLTGLKFTPVVNANGKSVIRVTSSQPVREPYLNFLMEVLWPNGRLLREYTVLLDPPLYAPTPTITATAAVAAAPAVVRPAPQPIARAPQAPVTAAPATRSAPAAAPVAASAPVASAGKLDGQYTSSKNDTLWEIALRARPAGASVHQTMLAIYDLNTGAFIDGNINRLKSGQVLRLPTAEQAKSRTSDEAVALVAEHNKAWKEGRSVAASSARQLDATRRDTAGAAPATSEKSDRLSLVSGQEGKAQGSDKSAAAGNAALQNKLAVTQETLDSSRRENTELKDRLKDLDSQLEKLQRLIKLKDAQLAKMQADLAEQGKATPVEVTPDASAPTEPASAAPEASVPAQPAVAEPAKPAETVDYNYTEEPAPDKPIEQAVTPPAPAAPVEPAPAPVVEAPKPAPQPAKPVQQPAVAQPVAPQETSFIDDLLADPMMLGVLGGSGVLVLLLGLMAISRRNAMKEANLQEQELVASDDSLDLGGDLDLGQDDDFGSDEALPQAADGKGDVLHEVEMLMAYGRFSQAAEQLNKAIDQ